MVVRRSPKPIAVVVLGLVIPLAAFVPFALAAWRKDVPEWDRTLSERIHAYENQSTLLNEYVDVLGLPLHWSVQAFGGLAVLGMAVLAARAGRRRSVAFILGALAGAIALTPVLKEIFAAPPVDPSPGSNSTVELPGSAYAFPSGHALRSVVFTAGVVAVTEGRARRIVLLIATPIVVATGIGVVYHEWHWTSDVLGGWFAGIVWITLLWLVFRPDREPSAPSS